MANSTQAIVNDMTPKVGVRVANSETKVEKLYVAVVNFSDGIEGIYSFTGPAGVALPVVATDERSLVSLSEFARGQARKTGQTVSIIGFTKRTHHDTFRPLSTGDKN